ncbi:MAG: hypothetical protein NT072_05710 [Deltaproteobacteria bacterium]|nr:hypothetical protein [Deltaproteobacteria bacterium]
MSEIQPKGEHIRQAIKWLSARLEDNDGTPMGKLIEQAGREFDLSPLDQEFLISFYKKAREKK